MNGSKGSLANWIRALRKQAGLTQGRMAERLGVTPVTISQWENRQTCPSQLALRSLFAFAESISRSACSATMANPQAISELHATRKYNSATPTQGHRAKSEAVRDVSWKGAPLLPANLQLDGKINVLRESPIFSDLDKEQLVELSRLAAVHHAVLGQFVYFEGDSVEYLYIVARGRIKILKHSLSGKDFIMTFIRPGEMFGNIALLSGQPHHASSQAMVDTTVLAIRNDDFVAWLSEHPESGVKLLTRILRTVGTRDVLAATRLVELAGETVERRLLHTLLTLSLDFGLVLPFTRHEIAQMSGTTTETAIRLVNRLRKSGIISPGGRKLVIRNQTKLEALSEDPFPAYAQ